MRGIEKASKIQRDMLSSDHYLPSLLEQGYLANMLSEKELEDIQYGCMTLLAKKVERYTGGDSSSIRAETAQELLASVLFTMDVQLKTYENPDDALAAVLAGELNDILSAGRNRVDSLVAQAKAQYTTLLTQLIQTENTAYVKTIVDGIAVFFRTYDPVFAAQEIHITADYPVYNHAKPLLGVAFIVQYLNQLYQENKFCTYFPAERVHQLLCGYDMQYHSLVFNLYEPILASALGASLVGMDAARLELTALAQSFLQRLFIGKKEDEVERLLHDALCDLHRKFDFPDSLLCYLKQSLKQLAVSVSYAAEEGTLDRIFIAPNDREEQPSWVLSYGEKMDNALYRRVLDQIMACPSMEEKRHIIQQGIHSLADLEDVLLDANFTEQEIFMVLQGLNPGELAAFLQKYLTEDEVEVYNLRSSAVHFAHCLRRFVFTMPQQQQAWLKEAAKNIQIVR